MNETKRTRRTVTWTALAMATTTLVACGAESSDAPARSKPAVEAKDATPKAASPSEAEPEEAEPKAAASPGVQPDGEVVSAVQWFHGSFEEALAKAKAEGKLVFMEVGAYWCPPCQRLDEEVFVRPEVGESLGHGYVPVHLDAEKGEGPELVERYKVQAFPTMLVLEATGVEKARIVDFLPAQELLAALERIAAGGNVLEALEEAVENDPDDLSKRFELAHAYLLAADAEAAQPQLEQVLLGDPRNEMGLASRALYDQALFFTYNLQGEPEAAIEEFRALQRRFPDSKEAVRAHRHIGRALCKLGRPEEAVTSLKAMVATDPDSPRLASSFGWFSFRQKCGQSDGLAAVQHGIAQAVEDADLRYVEAELLHQLGRNEEALASIRKASELEPKTAFYRRQIRRFEQLVGSTG